MKAIRRMKQEQEEEVITLSTETISPAIRSLGFINWRGMGTLALKEVHRFLKIPGQTILSPLIMTLLFYAVFATGMQGMSGHVKGVPILHFIVPGLIMMSMAQSAFMNTAASMILSKIQENIVDVLMAPLSSLELTIGYAFGGLVRGLVVGAASAEALYLLTGLGVQHVGLLIYYAVMGSLMLSLIGLVTGIWGERFDHMGGIQNFVIMPATFLSGTFFSVEALPEQWRFVCLANPFFYMIDGFRYAFIGTSDGSIMTGAAMLFLINVGLFCSAHWMFARGTFLKK